MSRKRAGSDGIETRRARWIAALLTGSLSAAAGIIINVATDLKTNVWAWLGVAVLVVAGAAVGLGIDKRQRQPKPVADRQVQHDPLDEGRVSQVSSGDHGFLVHVGGDSERITIKAGAFSITAGIVVIAATLAGLVVGARLSTNGAPRQSTRGAVAAGSGEAAAPAWVTSLQPAGCSSGWVVPDTGRSSMPVTDGPPPGATLGSGGNVIVTFQGVSDEAAVLHSISVEVLRRGPALRGIYLPGQCGSDVKPRFYATDLSKPSPTVVPVAGEDSGEIIPPKKFSYQVGRNDVEKIVVTPTMAQGYVEWVIHVKWSSGSRQGDLRIDDHGRPFRTTATHSATPWCTKYAQQGLTWSAATQDSPCS